MMFLGGRFHLFLANQPGEKQYASEGLGECGTRLRLGAGFAGVAASVVVVRRAVSARA